MARFAFGYDRVSTARQAGRVDLDKRYRQAMSEHCARRGWKLRKVFTDPGLSGKNAARPGLQAAVAAAIKAKGVIVFYDLSRFSRSLIDAVDIAERLRAHGAAVSSCTEAIDTSDDNPSAELTFHILASCAQFQRRMTGAKVKAKNAATQAELGYRTMGRQPIGWKLEGGLRVPCEAERNVVRRVVELAATHGYVAAAATLEAEGTPTISKLRGWNRDQAWNNKKVRWICEQARQLQEGAGAMAASEAAASESIADAIAL